jgi:acyl-coenzyme A thioesterase PaaI-like protein
LTQLLSVKNSRTCFGCGKENAGGLRLDFEVLDDGRLETHFTPQPNHGGWEGVFHGGLMATLLDEAMLAHLYLHGVDAATASLEVRYHEAVPVGTPLVVHAWEESRRGKLHQMTAEARWGAGTRGAGTRGDVVVVARATAKCLRIPGAKSDSKERTKI